MSAISVILLLAAGTVVALSAAVLHTVRGLRGEITALRAGLPTSSVVPSARQVPAEEIRRAVAEALSDERERELTEARAFWAEQEARDTEGSGSLLAGRGREYEVAEADEALLDALLEGYLPSDLGYGFDAALRDGIAFVPRQYRPTEDTPEETGDDGVSADTEEAAELAAARRRHPSHPGYTLSGEPVDRTSERTMAGGSDAGTVPAQDAEEYHRTTRQLSDLAEAGTPLADVRPGPLGTLDIFLFADGTTLCLSPGHFEAAERLAAAVRSGKAPVLMGGSGISGAYALTFSFSGESVYLLADRVVTAPPCG